MYELTGKRIFVAGHGGMVGSAIMRTLAPEDCTLVTVERDDLDLRNQARVNEWMATNKPDVVIIAAAKVGGIYANNTYPAEFLYDNLMIQSNVIHAAHQQNVEKLLFLGSSCVYPKDAPQPIKEEYLLGGALEPTNKSYAIAKIAGLIMCASYNVQHKRDFISLMPTNLYGPGDNYHPENAHVPAALLRRFHEAKINNSPVVHVWGSGQPLRDFMHVDDLARACVFALKHYNEMPFLNVGTGDEISIADFAALVSDVVGYKGAIEFDRTKPDGTMRKVMDISKIQNLGWAPNIGLRQGLEQTYEIYCSDVYTVAQ